MAYRVWQFLKLHHFPFFFIFYFLGLQSVHRPFKANLYSRCLRTLPSPIMCTTAPLISFNPTWCILALKPEAASCILLFWRSAWAAYISSLFSADNSAAYELLTPCAAYAANWKLHCVIFICIYVWYIEFFFFLNPRVPRSVPRMHWSKKWRALVPI